MKINFVKIVHTNIVIIVNNAIPNIILIFSFFIIDVIKATNNEKPIHQPAININNKKTNNIIKNILFIF